MTYLEFKGLKKERHFHLSSRNYDQIHIAKPGHPRWCSRSHNVTFENYGTGGSVMTRKPRCQHVICPSDTEASMKGRLRTYHLCSPGSCPQSGHYPQLPAPQDLKEFVTFNCNSMGAKPFVHLPVSHFQIKVSGVKLNSRAQVTSGVGARESGKCKVLNGCLLYRAG